MLRCIVLLFALCCVVCCRAAGLVTMPPVACTIPTVLFINQVEYVPLVPFAEVVGATASEDLLTGAVTITRGKYTLTCTPDQKTAMGNGKPVELPQAPIMKRAALYAPLREVVSALHGRMETDADVRNSTIRVGFPGENATVYKFPQQTVDDFTKIQPWHREVYIANPDGSGCKRLTYDLDDKESPILSPDGTSLCYCRNMGLAYRELDSHYEQMLLPANQSSVSLHKCQFTADGQQIFVSGYDGGALLAGYLKLENMKFQRLPDGGASFALSPDGKQVAYSAMTNYRDPAHLYLMDLDGNNVREVGQFGRLIYNLRFNRNGTVLAGDVQYYIPVHGPSGDGIQSNQSVFCYAPVGAQPGTLHQPAEDQRLQVKQLVDISPDGRYLLEKTLGANEEYWLCNSDLSNARQLPKGPAYENISFSADSKQLIYTRGDAAYVMPLDTLTSTPIPYTCPAQLTADGKYLLFVKQPEE